MDGACDTNPPSKETVAAKLSVLRIGARHMHYGEYVEEGLSKEQAATIESFSEKYSTAIPDKITKQDNSDDHSTDPDPKPEPISQDLHQLLLGHSFEEPVSVTEFEDYKTDELLEARQFIITHRDYRPSVAAPFAKSLTQRGEHDSAVSLLTVIGNTISLFSGDPVTNRDTPSLHISY